MYYKKEQEMMKKRVLCTRCQKGKGGRNGKRDRRRHTSGFHGRNRNFINNSSGIPRSADCDEVPWNSLAFLCGFVLHWSSRARHGCLLSLIADDSILCHVKDSKRFSSCFISPGIQNIRNVRSEFKLLRIRFRNSYGMYRFVAEEYATLINQNTNYVKIYSKY